MKQYLHNLIFIITIILQACGNDSGVSNQSQFEGGSGTQQNPYRVTNIQQLQAIAEEENLDKHFIQINDIDASPSTEFQDGSGFRQIGTQEEPFTGSYNGNGYAIKDLKINFNKVDKFNGLFGYAKNAELRNITVDNSTQLKNLLENQNIEFEKFLNDASLADKLKSDIPDERGIGGLLGINDGGLVNNCNFSGIVSGTIGQTVAGLVGINSGTIEHSGFEGVVSSGGGGVGLVVVNRGLITYSAVSGRITGQVAYGFVGFNYGDIQNSVADIDVAGSNGAAGFVRSHESGVIRSSIARGHTFDGTSIAGFVSFNNSQIRDTYSTTDLEVVDFNDNRNIAGFVVINGESGSIENSYFAGSVEVSGNSNFTKAAIIENFGILDNAYWDTERSDLSDTVIDGSPDGATGLTTAQMTGPAAEANMPEFDWMNVWRTTGDGYPVLRWEEE